MIISLTENRPTFNNGKTLHPVPLSGTYHIYYLGTVNQLSVYRNDFVPLISDILGLACITSWDDMKNYGTQDPRLGMATHGNASPAGSCSFYLGKRHINGYIDIQNRVNTTGSTENWAIHYFDVYKAF